LGFCFIVLDADTRVWASASSIESGNQSFEILFQGIGMENQKLGLSFRVLGVVKSGVSTAVKEADASRHNGLIKDPCITVNDTERCKVVWTNQGPDHFGQALSWLDMNCWGFWPGFIFPLVRN